MVRMRLSALIANARKEGVREIELHPDGSIARLVFDAPVPAVKKKEKTKQELLEEEKAKRNPARDALDVAIEAMGET